MDWSSIKAKLDSPLSDTYSRAKHNSKLPELFAAQLLSEISNDLKAPRTFHRHLVHEKLFYLTNNGYSIRSLNFQILELMSNNDLAVKKTGYALAQNAFVDDENVQMMAVNILKRDLGNPDSRVAFLSINFLTKFANETNIVAFLGELTGYATSTLPGHLFAIRALGLLAKHHKWVKDIQHVFELVAKSFDISEDQALVLAKLKFFHIIGESHPKWLYLILKDLLTLLDSAYPPIVSVTIQLFTEIAAKEQRVHERLKTAIFSKLRSDDKNIADHRFIEFGLRFYCHDSDFVGMLNSLFDPYLLSNISETVRKGLELITKVIENESISMNVKQILWRKIGSFVNTLMESTDSRVICASLECLLESFKQGLIDSHASGMLIYETLKFNRLYQDDYASNLLERKLLLALKEGYKVVWDVNSSLFDAITMELYNHAFNIERKNRSSKDPLKLTSLCLGHNFRNWLVFCNRFAIAELTNSLQMAKIFAMTSQRLCHCLFEIPTTDSESLAFTNSLKNYFYILRELRADPLISESVKIEIASVQINLLHKLGPSYFDCLSCSLDEFSSEICTSFNDNALFQSLLQKSIRYVQNQSRYAKDNLDEVLNELSQSSENESEYHREKGLIHFELPGVPENEIKLLGLNSLSK